MRRIGPFTFSMILPPIVWQVIFFLIPLAFLVVMTFWSVKNYRLQPDFTFDNWRKVFSASYFYDTYLRTLLNSLTAALVTSLVAFPVSLFLGLHAGRHLRTIAVFLLICPFFTSYLMRSYSWQVIISDNGLISALLKGLGLPPLAILNTFVGTLIGYATFFLPLVILLQFASLAAVDRELIQAAHNLRCGRIRTVFQIVLPSAKVGLTLGATFAFILAFGDFVAPSLLGGGKNPTLSILIIDTVKSASDWPRASVIALSMVATMMVTIFAALGFAYSAPKGGGP
jgi:spermidine/putrescine transport system permease protein